MISKKTKYGLQAMIYLAENYTKGFILIEEIAEHSSIPKKFLEAILLELRKKGILTSKKGKGGGYSLSNSPKETTVGSVIRVLEGSLALVSCVSQTSYSRCEECVDEKSCGIRLVMKEVRDSMADIMDHRSLADVLLQKQQEREKVNVNYTI